MRISIQRTLTCIFTLGILSGALTASAVGASAAWAYAPAVHQTRVLAQPDPGGSENPLKKFSKTTGSSSSLAVGSELINVNSGKCLEIGFNGTFDFNAANQYGCYGGPTQRWTFTWVGGSTYTLQNVNSGKCLEIGFGGKSDFNAANQYTCYGGPIQQWTIA